VTFAPARGNLFCAGSRMIARARLSV